jgi:radical SAM protein with 4Fe4S-binding SPASM domain
MRRAETRLLSNLSDVSVHPLRQCNLACRYCYLDARTTRPGRGEVPGAREARALARGVASAFSLSDSRGHRVVVSGGEPLLLPHAWFGSFFETLDDYASRSGRRIGFSLQTNGSIRCTPDRLALFRRHGVHFSVHYDGLLQDPDLQSRRRRDNIRRLRDRGFAVTVVIVGTAPALERLPETLDFLREQGIQHYKLNYVSREGRGTRCSLPPPARRAEAEFDCAFFASQTDFAVWDQGLLLKFDKYCRHALEGDSLPPRPVPQTCNAGVASLGFFDDGGAYPCSFFPARTGAVARLDRLPELEPGAREAVAACQSPRAYYGKTCPDCRAYVFCQEYCPLTPLDDARAICDVHRALVKRMDENAPTVRLIARRFREYLRSHPGDRSTACGTLSVASKEQACPE